MRKCPTRLEIHRLKRHRDGGRGPLLTTFELDHEERKLVSDHFFESVWTDGQRRDPYEIYAEVLAHWGVMCPHPDEKIIPGKHAVCGACGIHLGPYSVTKAPAARRAWG